MKRQIIASKNLPVRFPIWQTLVIILWFKLFPVESLIDKILFWFIVVYMVAWWFVCVVQYGQEEPVDLIMQVKNLNLSQSINIQNAVDAKLHEQFKRIKKEFEEKL